VSVTTSTR